jgi:hypothetical protein
MKRFTYALAMVALATLCTMPLEAFAAVDTLDVAALPPGNINTVLNGDTLTGGVRAHPDRVYRLTRGSVYQVTEAMKINGSITIMAPTGTNRPPVLAPAILSDNSSIDHFFDFLGKGGKVSMTNVYLLSQRADNNWLGWSDGFRIPADSVKLVLRGVIFDGFSDAGIRFDGHWLKADVQDCIFRNHQHSSAWFGGQPFMCGSPVHLDTVKFINNTFVANNSYSWSIRGYDRWSVFEHNTMVFGTVNPFLMRQGSHMRIKNNIFYAMHAMGGNPDHVINGWFLNYPDTASSSILRLRGDDSVSTWATDVWKSGTGVKAFFRGPEAYVDSAHGVTLPMLAPTLRKYDFSNNAYFWPKKLTDFYQAYNDTVKLTDSVDMPNGTKAKLTRKLYPPTWISKYAQWTMDSLYKPLGASVAVVNNQNTDPGFVSGVTNHIDSLIAYVWKICNGQLDNRWAYPNNTLYPPVWPLPENLAYTNAALQNAGSDGFALGDLNWFPTQKAAWKLTDVQQLDQIPQEFSLSQNYPNPFNPTTKIEFSLPKQSNVVLKVFNLLGQEVATLVSETKAAGHYAVDFDASHLASGAYVYQLTAGNVVKVNKMLFVK